MRAVLFPIPNLHLAAHPNPNRTAFRQTCVIAENMPVGDGWGEAAASTLYLTVPTKAIRAQADP